MKIEELVLNREQANHLQKLGLNMDDTANFWCSMKLDSRGNAIKKRDWFVTSGKGQMHCGMMVYEYIPTYTLQEIIKKLPKTIIHNGTEYELMATPNFIGYFKWNNWECSLELIRIIEGNNELERAYTLLCWIIENNYC